MIVTTIIRTFENGMYLSFGHGDLTVPQMQELMDQHTPTEYGEVVDEILSVQEVRSINDDQKFR